MTQGSNDRGIDVVAERSTPFEQKLIIQAKRYDPSSSVGGPEVQQYASLRQQEDNVDAVVIVTTGSFTESAEQAAASLNVKLIDGERLHEVFEAHDAYDILPQYLDGGFDGGAGALGGVAEGESPAPGETVETVDVQAGVDTGAAPAGPAPDGTSLGGATGEAPDDGAPEAPDNLPDLISLRKTIADDLEALQKRAERAEASFETKSFHEAKRAYEVVQEEIRSLRLDLARYEDGFELIDTTAAEHLRSPSEFQREVAELAETAAQRVETADELAEKADALETLGEEVSADAADAEEALEAGEDLRDFGRYDDAKAEFDTAREHLDAALETRETYRALAAGYDRALPDDHPEPPADLDLDALESRLATHEEWADSVEEARSYDRAATHDSVTEAVLTQTHTGAGFTNEPAESYLEPDELVSFAFHSDIKGYTVEEAGGGDKTRYSPDNDYGALYLVTDARVLLLTGTDDGDETDEIALPAAAEFSTGRFKNRLTVRPHPDPDREYHLWIDSEFDADDLEAAVDHIKSAGADGDGDRDGDAERSAEEAAEAVDEGSGVGLFDDPESTGHRSQSPDALVGRADGSFSKKVLTKTSGRLSGDPLVDHLGSDETLEYVLWHQNKGFRVIHPDGTEETPHHDAGDSFARFLLVTDRRVLYVVGQEGGDVTKSFGYDEIVGVEDSSGFASWVLTITTDDGVKYRFAETGTHANDVEPAIEYIRSRLQ